MFVQIPFQGKQAFTSLLYLFRDEQHKTQKQPLTLKTWVAEMNQDDFKGS